MTSLSSFYEDKIRNYEEQVRIIQEKISLTAWFRLIGFAGFAVVAYFLLNGFLLEATTHPTLFPALLLLAGYIALVYRSQQLKDRRALLEKLLFINKNELGILNHEPNRLPDGQAFLTNESYLDDLDIFGKHSLFHILNRTTSSHGRTTLSGLLKQSLQSARDIEEQQQAIRVLAGQVEQRQSILAHGLLKDENEGTLHSLVDWLERPTRLLQKNWVTIALWAVVVYNSSCLILWVITGNFRPLMWGILVDWVFNGLYARYFAQKNNLPDKKLVVLDQYAMTLQLFNAMDSGNSLVLEQLQARTIRAHRAIRKLSRIVDFLDRQANPTIGFLLNSLFVYNLRGRVKLEKWKQANKADFPGWIDAVGRIECLNSLAAFAFNNPEYVYPAPVAPNPLPLNPTAASLPDHASGHAPTASADIHSGQPDIPLTPMPLPSDAGSLFIVALQLAHPLLPAEERVANDFSLGKSDRILLVTGSNMSGKTTFLRTVGVNLLLAQCGAPVCAAAFSFTPMQILSSLRVSDSLQENTSYFMAELKKLQQIVHSLQRGQRALVLIDEILRGTNSEDKSYGSEQFLRKLLQYPCLSLFATHDLSLGRLEEEKPGLIGNYCFESVIEAGALHFDYRLQRGIARNRNASFLMEKMEII